MKRKWQPLRWLAASMFFLYCALLYVPVQAAKNEEPVTRIILVRHGDTDYNKEDRYQGAIDVPLNAEGLAQADLLAAALKDMPIDVFIASPMMRAYVTTEKCAKAQGMTIAYADKRLQELDYGTWGGRLRKDIAKEQPELTKLWREQPWKMKFPQGGSLQELQKRYRAALDDAVKKYPGKTIFIGAHSKGNAALICSLLGIGLEHYTQLWQDNTGVNVLEYRNGQWRLVLMNYIGHLDKVYISGK